MNWVGGCTLALPGASRQCRVELDRVAALVGKSSPRDAGGLRDREDRRKRPDRVRADERRVLQRGHLAADRKHVPGGGIRSRPEMVVGEDELLGQPAVEGNQLVVVDLQRFCRVVAHRIVNPGAAVVGLVEVRRCRQELPVVRHRGPPRGHRRKVEVGRLVLLDEDDHAFRRCHLTMQALGTDKRQGPRVNNRCEMR